MPTDNLSHDAAYREFFSNPDLVKSLLLDFMPKDFVRDFNFNTLELCNSSHITPELSQRHDDIIWRLRWQDTWCYIYILLEFQSTQDPWMALRIAVYTGLLWQSLIKSEVVKPGDKLPPVLPIVLYNGETAWNAPTNLKDLIARVHADLDKYQLEQEYFLVDENNLAQILLDNATGPSSYIFRLERARTINEIKEIYQEFMGKIPEEKFDFLRRSVKIWLYRIMKRRKLSASTSDLEQNEDNIMLEQKFRQWEQEFFEQGMLAGIAQGKLEGIAQGKLEEKKAVLANQKTTLMELLTDRFGQVPATWRELITPVPDPAIVNQLTRAILKVGSCAEFEELLKRLTQN